MVTLLEPSCCDSDSCAAGESVPSPSPAPVPYGPFNFDASLIRRGLVKFWSWEVERISILLLLINRVVFFFVVISQLRLI